MLFDLLAKYNMDDLLGKIGCIEQICSARKMCFAEGAANRMEVIDVRTGSGLTFQILSDRGLGLGKADYLGIPLAWMSPVLEVAPWYYHPSGNGWLESFGGGLMTSCGITNVGGPTDVEGVAVGLHGRLSHLPATNLNIDKRWDDDGKYRITITGTMLDHRVLGQSLQLERSYEVTMGESTIKIHDQVTNLGSKTQPIMILYHFNFGYPLISDSTQLAINPRTSITMRDEKYAEEVDLWNKFSLPEKGFEERVHHHLFQPHSGIDQARIEISNRVGNKDISVRLEFPLSSLNRLVEWKMLGEKEYVLGIEPGNCFASGRDSASEKGELEYLGPGEMREIDLTLSISEK